MVSAIDGAELWRNSYCKWLQAVKNNFLRSLLKLGVGTPLSSLYLELGIRPKLDTIALAPVLYWLRLNRNPHGKSYFEAQVEMVEPKTFSSNTWALCVKQTLNELGFSYLWTNPITVTSNGSFKIKTTFHEHKMKAYFGNANHSCQTASHLSIKCIAGLEIEPYIIAGFWRQVVLYILILFGGGLSY